MEDSNNSKILNDSELKEAIIQIEVQVAYTTDKFTIPNVKAKYNENDASIILNDIITDAMEDYTVLNKSAISYWDDDFKNFIYCGVVPFEKLVAIPFNIDNPIIKLKTRKVIQFDNLMKMELKEEEYENLEEAAPNINKKSKRLKERKINFIVEKVFLWRLLYNGFEDEKGKFIKLTLEEAAEKVKLSKKTLDDYLIQIRNGNLFNFNYNEHRSSKVGILRAFVKKQRFMNQRKKQLFDIKH